ncbi:MULTISPECIES: hypothetical protein [Pseudomonas syringae group]|uniref:Uncharacterized protein n=3 Tax=Pseudomonas syringae TaxID=317 RepID=A0AB73ZZE6_PSESX|nr:MULTISPECIES: hypothetical protein [Pseudomonas syringae group]ALU58596.1 hypothetical protein ACA40_01470 [Pseudomonas syringae pv. lapsa]KPX63655.1 Uncharacterized protein ALO39_01881 [Pseudomonas syringae pv. lapsa]KTC07767.1 hypothetical protein AO387_03830 [Pseudomonas syringae ICMP 11168]MBI6671869.1 hypothetical protein [Pseudomonas syringae]MBI6717957.1 hypothetical protein [Pseudomonas syringae]
MFDISHITALTSSPTLTTVAKEVSPTSSTSAISKLSSERSADSATLSTLSSQLNGSAMRAQIRDSRLGFKELGAVATSINDKITGTHYYANRALHDAEVPDTDDPALLERARQATLFKNGGGANPFSGLSQDQLKLIMYDEGGEFTINERSAASSENHLQQEAWNRAMGKRYVDEYNETGKSTQTLVMLLAHYDQLPPIEKAQYPANYAANITSGDGSAMDIFTHLKNQSAPQEA